MVIVSKQLKVPSTGKQLSDYAEGDIVKIPENGTPVEFYVAKHDYESELNGMGRTLVVRKECHSKQVWYDGYGNAYASSDIDAWFNSIYKNMLDVNIRSLIDTTRIRYSVNGYNHTVSTLERSIFALSCTELDVSGNSINVEGAALSIASTLKIAYLNGSANTQWTRSPNMNSSNGVWRLNSDGSRYGVSCNNIDGARPSFTLPSKTNFNLDTNIILI